MRSRVSFLLLQGLKCGSEALCSVFQYPDEETSPQPHPRKPGHHLDDCASKSASHYPPGGCASRPLSDSFLPCIQLTFSSEPSRCSQIFPRLLPGPCLLLPVITLTSPCLAPLQALLFWAILQRAKKESFRNATPTPEFPLMILDNLLDKTQIPQQTRPSGPRPLSLPPAHPSDFWAQAC